MSYSLDVNVLLFASNTSSERCVAAQKFLTDCAESPELLCVTTVTIMSYLRIATHPRISVAPLSVREAERNVERLLSLPQCVVISERDGFWQAYRKVTRVTPAGANDVPDAHLATVLFQNGVTRLYTHDRDFRRYDFLKVVDPFNPA